MGYRMAHAKSKAPKLKSSMGISGENPLGRNPRI